jgi:hypothetical protein
MFVIPPAVVRLNHMVLRRPNVQVQVVRKPRKPSVMVCDFVKMLQAKPVLIVDLTYMHAYAWCFAYVLAHVQQWSTCVDLDVELDHVIQ